MVSFRDPNFEVLDADSEHNSTLEWLHKKVSVWLTFFDILLGRVEPRRIRAVSQNFFIKNNSIRFKKNHTKRSFFPTPGRHFIIRTGRVPPHELGPFSGRTNPPPGKPLHSFLSEDAKFLQALFTDRHENKDPQIFLGVFSAVVYDCRHV